MNVRIRASYSESRMPRCLATLIADDRTTERAGTDGNSRNNIAVPYSPWRSCVTLGWLVATAGQHRQDRIPAKRGIGLRQTAAIERRLLRRGDHVGEATRRAEADAITRRRRTWLRQ